MSYCCQRFAGIEKVPLGAAITTQGEIDYHQSNMLPTYLNATHVVWITGKNEGSKMLFAVLPTPHFVCLALELFNDRGGSQWINC